MQYARTRRRPGFAAALVATLVSCGRDASAPAPVAPEVDVATPIVRELTEWNEYTGRLAAIDTVEVRPRVSGYLQSVHFKEGQVVKKGDLLFVIDPRPYQAALARAQGQLASAQANLVIAENDAKRAEGLIEKDVISRQRFETQDAHKRDASARVDTAKADVEEARLDLEYTEVRAPVDGRTSNWGVTIGNLVTGGPSGGGQATLLTTIVSLNPIDCYFDVSEQEYLQYTRLAASGIRPSSRDVPNPVMVALADEEAFKHPGHMDFVDNRIDPLTGTMRGRAVIDNSDGTLVPGMFVRIRLIGEKRPRAVLVPDEAIGTDQSRRLVYVVDDKNVVATRTVTPGRLIDGLRLVRDGLTGDEKIIVSGLQRVRPGATITPHTVDLGAAAANTSDPK
jgi:RND family efflux transporter MFP subunit